jgi:E3 ubiquitin-protein ligase RNF14
LDLNTGRFTGLYSSRSRFDGMNTDDESESRSGTDLATCRAMQIEEWEVLEVSFPTIEHLAASDGHLQSIHPSICISNDTSSPRCMIKLEIPIELGEERQIDIVPVPHEVYYATTPSNTSETVYQSLPSNEHKSSMFSPEAHVPGSALDPVLLSTLPPLHLHVSLPSSYPLYAPPSIQSLQAASGWVPPRVLRDMKGRMNGTWSAADGSGMLYTWVEWIRSGEFLGDIGMTDEETASVRYVLP